MFPSIRFLCICLSERGGEGTLPNSSHLTSHSLARSSHSYVSTHGDNCPGKSWIFDFLLESFFLPKVLQMSLISPLCFSCYHRYVMSKIFSNPCGQFNYNFSCFRHTKFYFFSNHGGRFKCISNHSTQHL